MRVGRRRGRNGRRVCDRRDRLRHESPKFEHCSLFTVPLLALPELRPTHSAANRELQVPSVTALGICRPARLQHATPRQLGRSRAWNTLSAQIHGRSGTPLHRLFHLPAGALALSLPGSFVFSRQFSGSEARKAAKAVVAYVSQQRAPPSRLDGAKREEKLRVSVPLQRLASLAAPGNGPQHTQPRQHQGVGFRFRNRGHLQVQVTGARPGRGAIDGYSNRQRVGVDSG